MWTNTNQMIANEMQDFLGISFFSFLFHINCFFITFVPTHFFLNILVEPVILNT